MSREIKFRAWDTENKCFFEPTYEAYAGRLEDLSVDFSGRLMRRTIEMPAEDESRFEGRYILSQYTGLKDRNGKEIYEGDIVMSGSEYQYTDVIKFENGCFCSEFYHIEDMMPCEVIGNIYENTNLLKE